MDPCITVYVLSPVRARARARVRACVRACVCVCRTVCGPVLRVADRDLAGIDNEALDFHIEDYINGDGSM